MECHNLQTFHWHTYTQQKTQHTVVATFQFFMLDDVELNHKGQQYILVHIFEPHNFMFEDGMTLTLPLYVDSLVLLTVLAMEVPIFQRVQARYG